MEIESRNESKMEIEESKDNESQIKVNKINILFVPFDATTGHMKRFSKQDYEKILGSQTREFILKSDKEILRSIWNYINDKNNQLKLYEIYNHIRAEYNLEMSAEKLHELFIKQYELYVNNSRQSYIVSDFRQNVEELPWYKELLKYQFSNEELKEDPDYIPGKPGELELVNQIFDILYYICDPIKIDSQNFEDKVGVGNYVLNKMQDSYQKILEGIFSDCKDINLDPDIIYLSEFALAEDPPEILDFSGKVYNLKEKIGGIAVQKIAVYFKEDECLKFPISKFHEPLIRTTQDGKKEQWLPVVVNNKLVICGVHLSSKYATAKYQGQAGASELQDEIIAFIEEKSKNLVINCIIGDFNANTSLMKKDKILESEKTYTGTIGQTSKIYPNIEKDECYIWVDNHYFLSNSTQNKNFMGVYYETTQDGPIKGIEVFQLSRTVGFDGSKSLVFSDHNPLYVQIEMS